MGRLVKGAVPRKRGPGGGLESSKGEGDYESYDGAGDNYLERVIKYIPSEVVAAYVALDGIFFNQGAMIAAPSAAIDTVTGQPLAPAFAPDIIAGLPSHWIAAAIFGICLLFTPIYIWTRSRVPGERHGTSWRLQGLISTLCFVVWAYATKGSLFLYSSEMTGYTLYNGQLAAAVLILFTLVSGLFRPGDAESS